MTTEVTEKAAYKHRAYLGVLCLTPGQVKGLFKDKDKLNVGDHVAVATSIAGVSSACIVKVSEIEVHDEGRINAFCENDDVRLTLQFQPE